MKVLQFIESGGPGGAERVVVRLARGLRTQGIDVAVCSLRAGWLTKSLEQERIPHHHLVSERSFDVTLPFRLARLIRSEQFDVLQTHLLDSNFYGAIAARIARVPHVATEHGDVHHIEGKRFASLKIRLLRWSRSRVIAVSEFTRLRLLSLGLSSERVVVIRNPIPELEPISPDDRQALRSSVGAENCWLWVHVANIRPVKDQETLLRGFARARTLCSTPQKLCLLGDGPARPSLEHLAGDLNLTDSVHFLGFRDDVPAWLQAADGFVLSSLSEALPMSLLEAVSAGLYIVSSDVGGISEIITSERGTLFPPRDIGRLADALAHAASHSSSAHTTALRTKHELCLSYSEPLFLDQVLDQVSACLTAG